MLHAIKHRIRRGGGRGRCSGRPAVRRVKNSEAMHGTHLGDAALAALGVRAGLGAASSRTADFFGVREERLQRGENRTQNGGGSQTGRTSGSQGSTCLRYWRQISHMLNAVVATGNARGLWCCA